MKIRADDDLQQALNAHDRVRKSTDLPLFFGRKDKDTVPPHLLLDRINRAATVANWNTDEPKITEFYLTLRDKAILWWDTLEDNAAMTEPPGPTSRRNFLPPTLCASQPGPPVQTSKI